MFNSIKSANCQNNNNHSNLIANKTLTKGHHYQQNTQTLNQHQHQHQHKHQNQHPNYQYNYPVLNHNHNHSHNHNPNLNPSIKNNNNNNNNNDNNNDNDNDRDHNQYQYNYTNYNKHNQSKQSSTISLNIHDTNDIRYSKSNTQLQLKRLSLSASLIDIYFGKHYRSPDVLVVSGFLLILIGLGAILIGVCVYFQENQLQEMTFLVGFAMAGIGFIFCSCRIILFGPPIFNCCLTIKTTIKPNNSYHNERRPTNPPFFTAASSAMSAVTSIGVRFNSGRSLSPRTQSIHSKSEMA